jgi:hypothetical protein
VLHHYQAVVFIFILIVAYDRRRVPFLLLHLLFFSLVFLVFFIVFGFDGNALHDFVVKMDVPPVCR